jgi:hypothetical protein
MTCADINARLAAWFAGTLSEVEARAVEAHAAGCATCGPRLDAASRLGELRREITPPVGLRDATLRRVAERRAAARWRRRAAGVAAVAAIMLLVVLARPGQKSASTLPPADPALLAMAHARPELAALDAAERDVQVALQEHPDDEALAATLQRIRRQRETLQRLVTEAKS